MVQTAETIFRDFVTDGVPATGRNNPSKPAIREWGAWLEGLVTAFTSNGGLIYTSRASIDGDLAHDAKASAWVVGDATVANNGIYQKQGASGAGWWLRVADLPYSFIRASNAGAGTANAIVATTSIPIPAADGAALITVNIAVANTGPATVAFNGGAALAIKTSSGADVQANYLVAGAIIAGLVSGSTFRLLSDVSTAADRAAAEAAASAASGSASSAAASATNAASYDPTLRYKSVADLLASTRAADGAGTQWQAGGYLYSEAASGASDHHLTTAGGVKLYVVSPSLKAWGVVDGTEQSALVQKAFDYVSANPVDGFDWSCDVQINTALVLGPPSGAIASLRIVGKAKFTATAAMDEILRIRFADALDMGDAALEFVGTGSTSYASRTVNNGLRVADANRLRLPDLKAQYLRGWALSQLNGVGENCNFNTIGRVRAWDCGSGYVSAGYTGNLTANWSSRTDPVTSDNVSQRTRVVVDTFPPAAVMDAAPIGTGSTFVLIAGKLHAVMAMDTGAGTIDVHPRITPLATTSGTLDWVFGGAISTIGTDANNLDVDRIDAQRCGTVVADQSLYGANIGDLQAASCGVLWAFGRPLSGASAGGLIRSLYGESDNLFEGVQMSSAVAVNNHHRLLSYRAIDLAKWVNVSTPIINSTGLPSLLLSGLPGIQVEWKGIDQYFEALPSNGSETFSSITVDMNDPRLSWYLANTKTFNLAAPTSGLNGITGRQGKTIVVSGTGSNNEPTGTLTFNPPAGGATVNGGASVAFSGLGGPAMISVYYQVASNNYVVSLVGRLKDGGWAAMTGTASKAALATYAGATHGGAYSQTLVQALDDKVKAMSQTLKGIHDALMAGKFPST